MPKCSATFSRRYPGLDAWRGVAALSVLLWHRYYDRSELAEGLWLGVQLFFVISGYCIAGAVDAALEHKSGFVPFMRRRIRRIGPPYLASIFVFIMLRAQFVFAEFDFDLAVSAMRIDLITWLQNLTMTPWVTLLDSYLRGRPADVPWHNRSLLVGVHWSLNYEEQFYLLAGAFLFFSRWLKSAALIAVPTLLAVGFELVNPNAISGLFVDYWLQFFVGVVVFLRLVKLNDVRWQRRVDLSLLLLAAGCFGTAIAVGQYPLDGARIQWLPAEAACLFFGAILVAGRTHATEGMRWYGRALGFVGRFSYSLYLIHQLLLERIRDAAALLARTLGTLPTEMLVLGGTMLCAYGFFLVFEKPYLNPALSLNAASTMGSSAEAQRS